MSPAQQQSPLPECEHRMAQMPFCSCPHRKISPSSIKFRYFLCTRQKVYYTISLCSNPSKGESKKPCAPASVPNGAAMLRLPVERMYAHVCVHEVTTLTAPGPRQAGREASATGRPTATQNGGTPSPARRSRWLRPLAARPME